MLGEGYSPGKLRGGRTLPILVAGTLLMGPGCSASKDGRPSEPGTRTSTSQEIDAKNLLREPIPSDVKDQRDSVLQIIFQKAKSDEEGSGVVSNYGVISVGHGLKDDDNKPYDMYNCQPYMQGRTSTGELQTARAPQRFSTNSGERDTRADLSLLTPDPSDPFNLQAVTLGDSISIGERVILAHYGAENHAPEAKTAALQRPEMYNAVAVGEVRKDDIMLVNTKQTEEGASGGAAINESGQVVGIIESAGPAITVKTFEDEFDIELKGFKDNDTLFRTIVEPINDRIASRLQENLQTTPDKC